MDFVYEQLYFQRSYRHLLYINLLTYASSSAFVSRRPSILLYSVFLKIFLNFGPGANPKALISPPLIFTLAPLYFSRKSLILELTNFESDFAMINNITS